MGFRAEASLDIHPYQRPLVTGKHGVLANSGDSLERHTYR